jgi:glycosyltransferase involved in cell wall biosynthesis
MANGSLAKSIDKPLVSVVIIFLNAEKFIREAVESVLTQTYNSWELLLVDDGSTDASTEIARSYAVEHPRQVRYLEHPDHQNRGMSASRNLGIRHTQGEYVAFLDADDVWLPHKLAEQVAILEAQPEAGMVWGNLLVWYSWTEKPGDLGRDYIPHLGVQPDTLIQPPRPLPLFLRGKAAVPGTCSILVRHSAIRNVGGFDEAFRGLYEDQAFYTKMCLRFPVYVSGACWSRYRQHPGASVSVARRIGDQIPARKFFLEWLREYLVEQHEEDAKVWQALQRELWRIEYPAWLPSSGRLHYLMTWAKKWLLRLEERTVPAAIQKRLWSR